MSRKTRKLIWSAPLVAVLAVAVALAMFAAQGTGGVLANPLPAAPEITSVEAAEGDAGRTTLVVTWTAAANASGYRIDTSDQGGVWETLKTEDDPHIGTTYMDTTLTSEDKRWYRVFGVNSHDGVGPVSNAVSGTTDEKVNPGSVTNLRATPNAKNPRTRLDLSWDAPSENGGEMIAGYEIQAHVDGEWVAVSQIGEVSPTPNNVTRVTKASYMDTVDKEPGDSQLYGVRAVNGTAQLSAADVNVGPSADGDASKEWVKVTGTTSAAVAPGQVTGLTAVNIDATQIDLYWYDPEDTGGWTISGYVIQAHRQGKKFTSPPSVATIKAATFGTTGPALGAGTDGVYVDNATWYQTKSTTGTLAQASFTRIEGRDDTEDGVANPVQQRWYFRVYAVTTDNGPDNEETATPGDAVNADNVIRRSASASNRANDTPAGREIDHDKDADRDDVATVTIPVDPLAAPVITPTGTGDNTNTDAKKQQIDLGLALNAAIVTNNEIEAPSRLKETPIAQIAYRIDYSEDGGVTWKLLEDDTRFTGFSSTKPYADDDGLDFDEQRHYRVFAIGDGPFKDVGPPCCELIPEGMTAGSTAPKKPTGVMASSPSLTSIMASWTAPEDNGGQPIVKYYYQYVPDDDDGVAEAQDFDDSDNDNFTDPIPGDTTDDAMTMATFTKLTLTGDTNYVFRVAAVNKVEGTGADRPLTATAATADWSAPVLFSTTEAAKPNAVEGLTSELATDASGDSRGVNLLWNKPSDDIAITNYDVEVQDAEGDWANPTGGENLPAHLTSYTDSNKPKADEMRVYRVRADNDVDPGPWTMVYYPRGPAMHMDHMLGDASGLTAVNNGDGTVTLSWTPGPNSNIHWVAAARRDGAGFNTGAGNTVWAMADMAASHTVDVSNLQAGTYAFTVIAGQYNADTGAENWNTAWTAFADAAAP